MRRRLVWLSLALMSGGCASASNSVDHEALAADRMERPTPIDPSVHTGTLANGLTYYTCKHTSPAHRAALWLVVKAGSVLEDDQQRGVAHLVEHMAFAGTKRFPGHAVSDTLEKAGMSLGPDAEGMVNIDQTEFRFAVPTDPPETMLKALDILRDIAGDVTFDPAALDKERAIVQEEWRQFRGASMRLREKQFPILFRGSRYAERVPIGLPETIQAATPESLRRFYKDWYRPDLMAVIAVGDFDPVAMATEIKNRFGDLVNPDKPRARETVTVPSNHELAIAFVADAESRFSSVTVYDKVDRRRDETKGDFRRNLVERLYLNMQATRLAEVVSEPTSPLVAAIDDRLALTSATDAIVRAITVKEGRLEEALWLLFHEIARTERGGFMPSQLDRARKYYAASVERYCREYDKAPLREIANELMHHFTDHQQLLVPENRLHWLYELLPTITVEEINDFTTRRSSGRGRVIVISTPNGATHPDEAQVRASVTAGLGDPIFPLLDETPSEPLMAVPPRPGEVVNVAYDRGAEATVWTLGNGVRVVVKPTNFRNDRIVIEGWQSGGTSAIADPDFGHARFAAELVGMSGAGKFDARTLSRLLAGKDVSVSINLAELGQQVSASARPEDLETMFQLLHLRLTRPRQYKNAFELMKNKYVEGARHRNDASDQRFSDEIAKLANGDHPRRRPISAAMLDDVDPDKALAIWKDRFSDFDDFTFAVVGNLDLDQLKPLVATYLGSLPSKRFHDHAWKNIRIQHPEGKIEKTVLAGKEARSRLWVEFSAPMPWTPDLMRDGRILERLLRIRLREILREDLGGAYTVTADVSINREPEERGTVHLAFSCAPDNVDHLRDALFAELARIAGGQIGDEILAKVSEQLRRHHEINRQSNKWWAGRLRDAYYFGQNFAEMNDIEPVIKRVNAANVAAVARRLFDDKRYLLGILRPAGS